MLLWREGRRNKKIWTRDEHCNGIPPFKYARQGDLKGQGRWRGSFVLISSLRVSYLGSHVALSARLSCHVVLRVVHFALRDYSTQTEVQELQITLTKKERKVTRTTPRLGGLTLFTPPMSTPHHGCSNGNLYAMVVPVQFRDLYEMVVVCDLYLLRMTSLFLSWSSWHHDWCFAYSHQRGKRVGAVVVSTPNACYQSLSRVINYYRVLSTTIAYYQPLSLTSIRRSYVRYGYITAQRRPQRLATRSYDIMTWPRRHP